MRDLVTFAKYFCSQAPKDTKLRDPDDFAQTNGAKSLFKSLPNNQAQEKPDKCPTVLMLVRDERLELPTFSV